MNQTPRWYEDGLRFACRGCGACCKGPDPGYVYVDQAEIERLAGHLELEVDAFGRRYLRQRPDGRYALLEKQNLDCVFWADEVGCSVYRARPGQCRHFPFWSESLASEESWEALSAFCPGVNKGRRYTLAEIDRILAGHRGTRSGRKRRGNLVGT